MIDEQRQTAAELLVLDVMTEAHDKCGSKRVTVAQLTEAAAKRGVGAFYLRRAIENLGVLRRRDGASKFYMNGPMTIRDLGQSQP